jgi:hypothetical protein
LKKLKKKKEDMSEEQNDDAKRKKNVLVNAKWNMLLQFTLSERCRQV